MPAILVFDVGKLVSEYKKHQDKTKYTPDDKIECLKKLLDIQEKYKINNDTAFISEYKKEYEACENIIKS